jgi:RNA polymerase sigma-70 factor (ECF subfamily)
VDTDAIDAARRGDQKAQAALLRELQDPWFRMCLSLLGDAERARDATQETALRFLKQLPTFAAQSKLMTWSMGIAINVVREMRRTSNRAVLDDGQIADARPAPGEGPVSSASKSEEHRMLRSMLGELPQRQREVIVLRFFEELSVEETAAAMDCAQGTVKATLHQALRALRRRIERSRNE